MHLCMCVLANECSNVQEFQEGDSIGAAGLPVHQQRGNILTKGVNLLAIVDERSLFWFGQRRAAGVMCMLLLLPRMPGAVMKYQCLLTAQEVAWVVSNGVQKLDSQSTQVVQVTAAHGTHDSKCVLT